MAVMVSRQGRQCQRYTDAGGRCVVGCIPYRFKTGNSSRDEVDKTLEVLVISSQKGHGMMFPKGGWENDETLTQAATREATEEAGVQGHLEDVLDKWQYRSKRYGSLYEATMFPLYVTTELTQWPEMGARTRSWVSVTEVMDGCEHMWMKEALEKLVLRLTSLRMQMILLKPTAAIATTAKATEIALFTRTHRRCSEYLAKVEIVGSKL